MIPNEIDPEKLAALFRDALTPRCKKCGAKLSPFPMYTEDYLIRFCKNCGAENWERRGGR